MPTIGSFSQDDPFDQEGTLETPMFKARVNFEPLRERSEKQAGLSHSRRRARNRRGLVGHRKIGGAYLFLKHADPSQPAPVCCNLYRNASGPAVLWTR